MNKTSIIGIDIEDYYGNAIENIEFKNTIEIDLEEFTVRVINFSFSETYEENGGTIARLQYDLENEFGGHEEVTQIQIEIMEILVEGADSQLVNENEISEKILNALEIIILK